MTGLRRSRRTGGSSSRIGLPPVALHGLRHTHASLLLATGTSTNADRLGHASAGFTLSTYGHSMPGRQADAVSRVAAAGQRTAS